MGEELLSLKWNNHQAHFVDILTFLREQEIFIDATLACGGKLYPAHKFVLSTCSEYFKQMFTKNPNKHPIVFLKDVTCKDLEALLDFMYNGEVNVPQSSLGSLIKTAEGLQIKGLAVPDDPPTAMKKAGKENRDLRFKRDRSFSPPASKRLRETHRSPLRNSSASILSNSSPLNIPVHKSPSPISNQTSVNLGLSNLETLLDESSRTSVNSGVSEQSHSVNVKHNTNSHDECASLSDNMNEPSPGPSGMHKSLHSKEEEMEIKQEDMGLVDLGQDEEDWRDGDDNLDDKSRDSSIPSVNIGLSNFADGLIPPSENTGERAMTSMLPVHSNWPCMPASNDQWLQRNHCCYICNNRFRHKHHLVQHIRTHTGEKPFVCNICSRSFSQLGSKLKHEKRCQYNENEKQPGVLNSTIFP